MDQYGRPVGNDPEPEPNFILESIFKNSLASQRRNVTSSELGFYHQSTMVDSAAVAVATAPYTAYSPAIEGTGAVTAAGAMVSQTARAATLGVKAFGQDAAKYGAISAVGLRPVGTAILATEGVAVGGSILAGADAGVGAPVTQSARKVASVAEDIPVMLQSVRNAQRQMAKVVAEDVERPSLQAMMDVKPSKQIVGFTGAGEAYFDEMAEAAYSSIRKVHMDDIPDVSKNTGLSLEAATTLKKHLFFGKHQLPQPGGKTFKLERFAADDEIAHAWQLAQKQELTIKQQDWFHQLANHELGERQLMWQGIPYRNPESWDPVLERWLSKPPGAHDLAPSQPAFGSFPGYEPSF